MTYPKIGNLAPKFNLFNQDGEKVALKDLIGKTVVLYFYPKAMTPGCITQACGITDYKKEFSKLKTVVIGISTSASAVQVALTPSLRPVGPCQDIEMTNLTEHHIL